MLKTVAKTRIDKYLWAIRIFKTRTLAGQVVRAGKVRINDQPAKPASPVSPGDRLQVRKAGYLMEYEAVQIIERRVSAPLAQQCYFDLTPESELLKYQDYYIGKAQAELRSKGAGRPTKLERRQIDEWKKIYLELNMDDED